MFGFSVTSALKDSVGQSLDFFSLQGRVNESLADNLVVVGQVLMARPTLVYTPAFNLSGRTVSSMTFKQRSETTGSLGLSQLHHARSMLGAIAARRSSVQNRLVLAGVEMTPTAFGLMIVEGALHVALRAGPALLLVVFEEDVDFTVGSAQLHVFDLPRTLDA